MRIEAQPPVPAQSDDAQQKTPHPEHNQKGKEPFSPSDRNHTSSDERDANYKRDHEPSSGQKDPSPLDRAWVLGWMGSFQLCRDDGGLIAGLSRLFGLRQVRRTATLARSLPARKWTAS